MNYLYARFMKEPKRRLPRKLKKRLKKEILKFQPVRNMQKLDQLYNEWCSLQPLKPEYQKRLDDKFKLEFNYNSNHLEGNTLTYGQTKLLFMFGETSGNASLKDYEEMQAHNVGLEMMKVEAADKERPLTESFLRALNKTILVQNYWKNAQTASGDSTRIEIKVGDYKSRPNSVRTITGEEFHYASPEETPAFMTALVDWYNQEEAKGELNPIELASLLHYRYIRIHPFEDGNGRIARLLVNYVLYRNGYPMLVVHTADKDSYLRVLHQSDINVGLTPSDGANATIDQIKPFVEYMQDQLQHALEVGIRAAKGEDIEEEGDFAKRVSLLQRKLAAKNENTEPGVYNATQFWNIAELFYIPLTEKIEREIQPVNDLFSKILLWRVLSKSSNTTQGMSFHAGLKHSDDIDVADIIKNAKSLTYHCVFQGLKGVGPNAPDITIDMTICFGKTNYKIMWIPDKEFTYGSFPSEEDSKKLLHIFRNILMQKIEEAME